MSRERDGLATQGHKALTLQSQSKTRLWAGVYCRHLAHILLGLQSPRPHDALIDASWLMLRSKVYPGNSWLWMERFDLGPIHFKIHTKSVDGLELCCGRLSASNVVAPGQSYFWKGISFHLNPFVVGHGTVVPRHNYPAVCSLAQLGPLLFTVVLANVIYLCHNSRSPYSHNLG